MEPPTKRRRLVESDAEDSDDDELAYEPQEIVARRDPDYRLSLKRAYADHKFQATMAHIFEKYGRDFEGIGDEIDMVTGEIIVNNGHLDRMRNEGDVGIDEAGRPQEEGEQDEEEGSENEGIRLSDLFGAGFDDNGNEDHHHQADQTMNADDATSVDDDEERILQGRASNQSLAKLPPNMGQPPFQEMGGLPSILSDPFYSQPPMGIGGYGSPPGINYGFGTSPFAMGPWDLPPNFAQPAWSSPRPPSLLGYGGKRFEIPAPQSSGSIWGPASAYNEALEPVHSLPSFKMTSQHRKPVARYTKKIMPPPRPETGGDEDEDLILAGKSIRPELAVPDELGGTLGDMAKPHSPKATSAAATAPASSDESLQCPKPKGPQKSDNGAGTRKPAAVPKGPPVSGKQRDEGSQARASPASARTIRDSTEPSSSENSTVSHPLDQSKTHGAPVKGSENRAQAMKSGAASDRNQAGCPENANSQKQAAAGHQRSSRVLVELKPMSREARDEYLQVDIEDNDAVSPSAPILDITAERIIEDSEAVSSSAPVQEMDSGSGETAGNPPLIEESEVPDSEAPGSSAELSAVPESRPDDTASSKDSVHPQAQQGMLELSDDEAPTFFVTRLQHSGPKLAVTRSGRGTQPPTTRKRNVLTPTREEAPSPCANDTSDTTAHGNHAVASSATEDTHTAKPRNPRSSRKATQKRKQPGQESAGVPEPVTSSKGTPLPSREDETDIRPSTAVPDHAEVVEKGNISTHPATQGGASSPALTPAEPTSKPNDSTAAVAGPAPAAAAPSHQQVGSPSASTPAQSPSVRNRHRSGKAPAPSTPRHSVFRATRAPSSRRSVLSLVSDDEDDNDDGNGWDKELDELGRITGVLPRRADGPNSSGGPGSGSIVRKLWRSSARTTEIYRTPVKKHRNAPTSPWSTVKTPGGTVRTCGVDRFRCGRDFCFTCL